MEHKLKILPKYFKAVKTGAKPFEFRFNDRDYKIGDVLILQEWDNDGYTGQEVKVYVTYVLNIREVVSTFPLWCILGIRVI